MRKLFYGLAVSDQQAIQLCEQVKQHYPELSHHIKWVKSSNYHITLRFIGYVKHEKVAEYAQVLHDKMGGQASFTVNINRITRFPNKNSRVIAGRCELSAALTQLFAKLNSQAQQLGAVPDTRDFKPHVTLGRTKSTRLATFEPVIIHDIVINMHDVILYESVPGQFGNDYCVIERCSLL